MHNIVDINIEQRNGVLIARKRTALGKEIIEEIGRTPDDIVNYMHKLSRQDGRDFNDVLKKALD